MTRRSQIMLLALAAAIATVSLFAEQPHCKAAAKDCAEKIRAILANKSYLGVTLEDSRWGTIIREVTPDSPAARAGLVPDDRILFIDHHDCTRATSQEIKQILMPGEGRDTEFTIVVSRFGKIRRIKAKLGLMPKEKIEKIVQRHIETAHNQEADEE